MSELALKWRTALDAARRIFTWTTENELAWLAEQASQHSDVLEIGTYMGASAKVMAGAGAHVTCLDVFETPNAYISANEHLKDEIAAGRVTLIQGDAGVSALKLLSAGATFSMIWIDDGHTFNDVVRDCMAARLLARPGTLICGHDYEGEVEQAVNACFGAVKRGPDKLWYL
jgi:predicted O-methyltransferase YrrM